MRLISDPAHWAGELPAVAASAAGSVAERRLLLRALVARVLGRPVDGVWIEHQNGRAPSVAEPRDCGLHLSSASRCGLVVVAVARTRIGVDVEVVEPGTEPPWNVLHTDERAWLSGLPRDEWARSFARLWAAKEAYLKALGLGFRREPSGFAILPAPDCTDLIVRDPGSRDGATLSTRALTHAGRSFATCLAVIGPPP